MAATLPTQTALGVDKAQLYDREAHIADSLQREMLPDSLPQSTGVGLATPPPASSWTTWRTRYEFDGRLCSGNLGAAATCRNNDPNGHRSPWSS
ncbi:MAG: hypothetical protein JWL99_5027 [Streptomyces oryziradicis]|nr:hypothetical protein [Actinacidiphila oryziradicis]